MTRALVVLFVIVLALMGSSVESDAAGPVPDGSRVRVSVLRDSSTAAVDTPAETKVIGRLEAVAGDTLRIRADDEPVPRTITIDRIRLLEVSRGVRSHSGRGALIGFGVGAAAGVASAFVVCQDHDCYTDSNDQTAIVAFVFGLGGGLTGLGVGALIGGASHSEEWESVPLNEVRVGVLPSSHGRPMFAAALTRRF